MTRSARRLLGLVLALSCAACGGQDGPVARATVSPGPSPAGTPGQPAALAAPPAACAGLPADLVAPLVPDARPDGEQEARFEDSVSATCGWTSAPDPGAGRLEVAVTRYAGPTAAADRFASLRSTVCSAALPEPVGEASCLLLGEGRRPGQSVVAYAQQDDLVVQVTTARQRAGAEDELVEPVTAVLAAAVAGR